MARIKQLVVKFFAWYHRKRLIAVWAKRIKKDSPTNVLTPSQEREIAEYFKPYCKVSPLYHNFYTDKTGKFYKNYIPNDIYDAYIDPFFNRAEEAFWVDNKCFYEMYFPQIKQPETIARRINSYWFVDGKIVSEQVVLDVLQKEPALFVKEATVSFGGKGIAYIENRTNTFTDDLRKAIALIKCDIVIQKPLRQHAALSRLNESSVNTVRCISLLKDNGEVCIYSTVLRIGMEGAKVDNASSGGITIGITSDATLKKFAFTKHGEKCQEHPTSGVTFDGYIIPGYEKVIESVKKAHWMVPRFRLVSWDFCINETGEPVLIEANLDNGELDFHQLNNGPLFGEDTEMILKQVFGKQR